MMFDRKKIEEKYSRYGIWPGAELDVFEIENVKDGKGVTNKYRVVELYPNIVLCVQMECRYPTRRSFDYWSILKATGKIPEKDLRGEVRRRP